jgi:hypothetical protein
MPFKEKLKARYLALTVFLSMGLGATTLNFTKYTGWITESIDMVIAVMEKLPELAVIIAVIGIILGVLGFITGFFGKILGMIR